MKRLSLLITLFTILATTTHSHGMEKKDHNELEAMDPTETINRLVNQLNNLGLIEHELNNKQNQDDLQIFKELQARKPYSLNMKKRNLDKAEQEKINKEPKYEPKDEQNNDN